MSVFKRQARHASSYLKCTEKAWHVKWSLWTDSFLHILKLGDLNLKYWLPPTWRNNLSWWAWIRTAAHLMLHYSHKDMPCSDKKLYFSDVNSVLSLSIVKKAELRYCIVLQPVIFLVKIFAEFQSLWSWYKVLRLFGLWWWYSGRHPCLLLRWSEFKSCCLLIFCATKSWK